MPKKEVKKSPKRGGKRDDKHKDDGKKRRPTAEDDLDSIHSDDEKAGASFNAPSTSRRGKLSERPKVDVHLLGSSMDNTSLKSCSTVETDLDKESTSTLVTSPDNPKPFPHADDARPSRRFGDDDAIFTRPRIRPLENIAIQSRPRRHTAGPQSLEFVDLRPGTSRQRSRSDATKICSPQKSEDEIDSDSDTPPPSSAGAHGHSGAQQKATKTEQPEQRLSLKRRMQTSVRSFFNSAVSTIRSARIGQATTKTDKKFGLKKGTEGADTTQDEPKKEEK